METSQLSHTRYIIGGPCGVGKSTIAQLMADRYGIKHLDLDEIGSDDMKKRAGQISPCSTSFLNLEDCLSEILNVYKQGFALDVGGDSIFREGKDNQERVNQVLWLKHNFDAKVIVLFAKKSVVSQRFLSTKNRGASEFNPVWQAWNKIEKPHWQRCADKFIDISSFSPERVLQTIIKPDQKGESQ